MVRKTPAPSSTPAVTRCWSYRRFSSPEQSSGDSTRRQRDAAARYAEKHGLVLDEKLTFADLGKSGYTGANIAEGGQLHAFLGAIEKGLVPPGSILLVEHLDRLSRQGFYDALVGPIHSILKAGISIVTLSNEQKYDLDTVRNDPMAMMQMLFTLSNAKAESQLKSQRIGAAWKAKRALARTLKTPMSAKAPGWLTLDRKAGKYRVIEDRAAIVRRIFQLTLQGKGKHAITILLNTERVPVFGRGKMWQAPYLRKILTSSTVIGTFTPHTVSRAAGKLTRTPETPIPGFYPTVVTQQVYNKVQALLKTHTPLRGRHSEIRSIFASLGQCPKCHGTLTRVYKGNGPKGGAYLVCAKAKVGAGCTYHAVPYQLVEDAFLKDAGLVLRRIPAGGDTSLDAALKNAEAALEALKDQQQNLERSLRRDHSRATEKTLRAVEQQIAAVEQEMDSLEDQVKELSGPIVAHKVRELQSALRQKPLDRGKVNAALRVVFASAVVDYTGESEYLRCQWRHAPDEEAAILYRMKPETGTVLRRRRRRRSA